MGLDYGGDLMAHYESETFHVKFDLPDKPTARQVLSYDSMLIEQRDEPALVTLWECARAIIVNWECEYVPHIETSLDELEGIEAAQAIEWAATQTSLWRTALNAVPKN